ncbi:RNA polymerase II transcription factor SIII subunit A-domain-containing protein [Collybia nuda]|uniref:RNA polymerase II transcription factor SIII subunit A-domain-containing protein n=1 Tax=Collybia nuda TaxID=64659 RepID=A0A9P5YII9_9AGAR|nr:RNA polymerase II transcription factor SIII subunit A-domain-containing protein [Collybia nuda]
MDLPTRQLPTLVQLCQRIAGTHVDYITSLGDDLTYSLVKPILERCSPEHLLKLEQTSPHLQKDTPEIWKALCFQKYRLAMERHLKQQVDEPESWKDHYFFLGEEEAKRLEEAGTKLRNQRLEAEERKREREVKITDRLPPPKRQRTGWNTNPQPKSLFDKTKTKTSQLQKNMYQARIIPPMPNNTRAFRILSKPPGTLMPLLPPSDDTSRVTVSTVIHRRPVMASTASSPPTSSIARPTSALSPPRNRSSVPVTSKQPNLTSGSGPLNYTEAPLSNNHSPTRGLALPSTPSDSRPLKPPTPGKRDPMAALFVPKRRTQQQRPV